MSNTKATKVVPALGTVPVNTTPRAHIRREKVSRYRGLTMTAMVGRGETKASTFCGAPVTDRDMLPADARDTMKYNAAGQFGLCLECVLTAGVAV